jgi:MoxR-like ATPase
MSELPTLAGWPENPADDHWSSSANADKILGIDEAGKGAVIPMLWVRHVAKRIHEFRNEMRDLWVGLELGPDGDHGYLTDWVIAVMIARENGLLLGGPGTGKTEIAERAFTLLGLNVPAVNDLPEVPPGRDVHTWWSAREARERKQQKYFSYLLTRFTEPEEIFGPIEISLLRRGMLVRVNFGMLTGPGVRAALLDEVFKASASILNATLRLVLNREYFNWGGMRPSDLVTFLAASNELPGGLGSGDVSIGASGEDFSTLHAFLDRFPTRLAVPVASGTRTQTKPEDSDLASATKIALRRERQKMSSNELFVQREWNFGAPSLNDLLLAGRVAVTQSDQLFDSDSLASFERRFYRIAANLQQDGTNISANRVTWTITPRKLKALWKIALAHAVVRDDGFANGGSIINGPGYLDLRVFNWIWDAPGESKFALERRVTNSL